MATNGDDNKLVKVLSNSIKDLVAPDPPQGQQATQCFVMTTGFTLNPDSYDPDKSADSQKELAMLFNEIPKVSPAWERSGKFISNHWEILLTTGKAPLKPPPSPEAKKRYQEAIEKLYGNQKKFEHLEKSPLYKSLETADQEVTKAQMDLLKLENDIKSMLGGDATQAKFNSTYQRMSPPYINRVKTAQQQLILRQREISRYTTDLFAYNTGSLETILSSFATSTMFLLPI
jgi:hypothetical protein